jgi:poly-gamma-glutamate synthesis protein (capsule biosynthesis protein)
LNCSPDALELLAFLNFDIALLANNHTGDQGGEICMETINRLNDAGIKTVGAGENVVEAAKPLRIECDGVLINILNFAEHEFGTATATAPGCSPLDPLANIEQIREADETADLVIVAIHGGHERYPLPSPRMTQTSRAFVDAGAAAVFNCHTHCPGPVEIWNGAPIIYSPGNFFFPWGDFSSSHLNALWWKGYIPKLHFDKNGIHAIELLPCGFDNEHIHLLSGESTSGFFKYMELLNELVVDDKKVVSFFEAWSAKYGGGYLNWLRDRLAAWPIDMNDRAAVRELLPVRNVFTCEAHKDLVEKYLRLLEEGRVEKAIKGWEAIAKLQSPDWAI